MENSRWNESYFGVKKPHISEKPHIIFEPKKEFFDIIFHVIDKVPGIWGLPVPYDKDGKPTVDGADRWGLCVKREEDMKKLSDYGWFIPIHCDDSGNPIFPSRESGLAMNAWSYKENQKALSAIWNLGNDENDKMILDCNRYNSKLDHLIEAFFEIQEDITCNIDQLLEELDWFIFPIGHDEEYSVFVAINHYEKLISQVIEDFEKNHLKYRMICPI